MLGFKYDLVDIPYVPPPFDPPPEVPDWLIKAAERLPWSCEEWARQHGLVEVNFEVFDGEP